MLSTLNRFIKGGLDAIKDETSEGVVTISKENATTIKRTVGVSLLASVFMAGSFYIGYRLANRKHIFKAHASQKNEEIEKILNRLKLKKEDLSKVMDLMLQEMKNGLDPETHDGADIKMFPSYVRDIPTGDEVGDVLALDLGGTNFRVLLINLAGTGEVKVKSKVFLIPHSIMTGTGDHLFDHIARCLADFMKAEKLTERDKPYPLGFTFSFPCSQNNLNSATLVKWTKGFDCDGVVGEDVVQLLQNAIDKRGVKLLK
jgi:hexokinase